MLKLLLHSLWCLVVIVDLVLDWGSFRETLTLISAIHWRHKDRGLIDNGPLVGETSVHVIFSMLNLHKKAARHEIDTHHRHIMNALRYQQVLGVLGPCHP